MSFDGRTDFARETDLLVYALAQYQSGKTFAIDKAIGDVSADQFDGLVIPGGSVGADRPSGTVAATRA